jgi:hypothetical protein
MGCSPDLSAGHSATSRTSEEIPNEDVQLQPELFPPYLSTLGADQDFFSSFGEQFADQWSPKEISLTHFEASSDEILTTEGQNWDIILDLSYTSQI